MTQMERAFLVSSLMLLTLTIVILMAVASSSAQEVECHEDEPCWDCETMGNQLCGPLVYDATVETVTLSEFIAEAEAQYGEGVAVVAISATPPVAEPAPPVSATPRMTG